MKNYIIILSLLVILSASGCMTSKLYKATYDYSGASPYECDELCLSIATKSDLDLVRTVAKNGQFTLFFKSEKTPREIQEELLIDGKELPGRLTIGKLESIGALPPKPQITMVPNLNINPDSKKMALFGISIIDINKTLQSVNLSDIDSIRKAVIKKADGKDIQFQDIANITIDEEPSHIVKDY